MKTRHAVFLMLLLGALPASLIGQKQDKPAVIWRDPGPMASLNLLYGAGGIADAPDAKGRFVFVSEDMEETSPKFTVKDDRGVEWRVKLGQEPQSETAATRFLSTANNSIDEVAGERRYVVSDVGATFGNTGNNFTRSKSAPGDYAAAASIDKATPDFVDFSMHSRPFFLSAINVPNYRDRTRMEQITKHIPHADATWLGRRLAMLSDDQIRDGFRAAGYTPDQVEVFTQAVRKRITGLNAL